MTINHILVTGANGFIGSKLCWTLERNKYFVRRVSRSTLRNNGNIIHNNDYFVREINQDTEWGSLLEDIDSVIHLAGRAHILNETEKKPLSAFRYVNTLGTECLARAAAEAGVYRFVYISSIGVNGKINTSVPFTEQDRPLPHNAYAISKWEAEQILYTISKETDMEVVIVRPPLVYGPEVKANFLRLLEVIDRGIPLPLGSVKNARSLVSLDNLIDFIITCLEHPAAKGETFLIADGVDLSTPGLIRKIAQLMDRPCRLFPFPPSLIRLVGKMVSKEAMIDQLCGSLQVDISKARNVLGWEPPVSVDEELKKTVDWYTKNKV